MFFSLLITALSCMNPFMMTLSLTALACSAGVHCWVSFNKWVSLVVLLVFVGGMMVVFFYATSLSKNEKTVIQVDNPLKFLAFMALVISSQKLHMPAYSYGQSWVSSFFSAAATGILMFLVFYLLLVLLVLVKLSENFKGAIKLNKWL